jgi:hypothetical protein
MTARQVHDVLAAGTLIGAEAGATTVRFDYGTNPITLTSTSGSQGSYSNYHAEVRIPWLGWLDQGDRVLFHEYGHAWSLYYAYMVQQDSNLTAYLQARGIAGDSRLDSSHAWSPREMIAEDYRQLFGATAARDQENKDVPPAADVPGLRDFLSGTFRQAPAPSPTPTPDPTPTPTPETAPALAVTGVQMNPTTVKTTGTAYAKLSATATVTVTVRDAKGALVRTLLDHVQRGAGDVSAAWDRKNAAGARVKSGTYSVVVEATGSSGQATGKAAFQVS